MDPTNAALDGFDENRPRVTTMALRILGSHADADDAVQEVWLRVSRAETADIENVAAWLTTITARVCLNVLRSRRTRRVDMFDSVAIDTSASPGPSTEDDIVLADSVSIALLVVLETLEPAERLAFVLHDMFAMPFDEIAPILDRTTAATRQLASRARRRVRDRSPEHSAKRNVDHRRVVDAFFAAARGGSLDELLAVLDPDVVLRSHSDVTTTAVNGARNVAGRALHFAQPTANLVPVVVDGKVGVLVTSGDRRISLMVFTVEGDQIAAIDALIHADRLRGLLISAR